MYKFKIYGDYGYVTETLLDEYATLAEAEDWLEAFCDGGAMCGFAVIEIATFAADGEYVVHRRVEADEDTAIFY